MKNSVLGKIPNKLKIKIILYFNKMTCNGMSKGVVLLLVCSVNHTHPLKVFEHVE